VATDDRVHHREANCSACPPEPQHVLTCLNQFKDMIELLR
jgi:hypothetical protein